MKKQLQFLILLAFIAFSSSQLNAQDETFDGNTDVFWSNTANWTNTTVATGQATLNTSVNLGGNSYTVDEIIIGGTAVTISNGTLTIQGTTDSNINPNAIGNANHATTIFDCDVIFDSRKRIRNSGSGTITFAAGKTVDFGSNNVNFNNQSDTNPIVFQGSVSGTGTSGVRGRVLLGSSSDFTGFTGTLNFTGNFSGLLIVDSAVNSVNSSITSDINVSHANNPTAEVLFNTNQNNLVDLSVSTALTLNFDPAVTAVQFSGIDTMTGVVNLQNYTSGVLKIGTTATTVSQTILDTWLIGGVEPANGTIVQDTDGSIIIPTYTSTTGTGIDWEDGTSWVGGTAPTTATDNVYIQGSLIIKSDVTVNNFTILSGGAVTVNPTKSLTVNGNAATNDNLFAESNATSFSSLIFNSTVSGEVGYNRWVHATPTNDLISAPVPETFGDIEAGLLANPSDATQKAFGPFDNVIGLYVNWDTTNNTTNVLEPGKGYRAARAIEDGTILFQGEPVSPAVDVEATLTAEADPTYGLWNLIGNPYPSYLDFGAFWTENSGAINGGSGAYQAVYAYNGAASGDKWEEYNNINLPLDDKIAPGQGFFIRTITGGTVTFKPDMRTIGNSDDFILNRTSTPDFVLSELFLSDASSTQKTKIYFTENQTRGLDPGYDAAAFTGASNGIYTNLVEDNEGLEFAIQALSDNDLNDVVVPLGIKSDAGAQLTIGLNTETTSIPSGINVYLEDNVANTWTLLNAGDYVFTPSENLNGTGRFFVHFSNTTLGLNDNVLNGLSIYNEQVSKTVVVKGQLNTSTTATVYDMQGRLVLQQALDTTSTTNTVNVNAIGTGVYIVELKSETQNRTQKIIIK